MIQLHAHQAELLARVREKFASGTRRVLVQGATGIGKNAIVSVYVRELVAQGKRVVFAAHLDALLDDLGDRLAEHDIPFGFLQGDRPTNADAPVQIVSVQTIHARGARPAADLLILDEAHRAMAPTVRAFLDAYPSSRCLGATATPERADGRPLGDCFDDMVSGPSVRWLTERGFLVPCSVIAPAAPVEGGLAADPVDAWFEHTHGRRAIVFAGNVRHAEAITERFDRLGVPAECITGETSRAVRRGLRARLLSGESRVLVSVGVFLEGFDAPCIETVILARAFGACGSYLQAIGRGLRPSPSTGKTDCTVLDLVGAVHRHGLPQDDRVWSLEGEAVRRTGEALQPMRRCRACLAIFRPTAYCPRCGAETHTATTLPRVLSRGERLELVNALPLEERDKRYLAKLEWVGLTRMRLTPHAAKGWALRTFIKQRHRVPAKEAA